MELRSAKIVARYPGAFSSETLLEALLELLPHKTRKDRRIPGDPDAPEPPADLSGLVESLEQTLQDRHDKGRLR